MTRFIMNWWSGILYAVGAALACSLLIAQDAIVIAVQRRDSQELVKKWTSSRSPLLLPSALRVGDCVRVLPTAERHHPGEPDQEEWDAARNLHIGQIGKLRSIMVGGDTPETMQEVPANLEWVVKFPGDEYGWGYRPDVLEVATCQK